jgi:hypothetical protein
VLFGYTAYMIYTLFLALGVKGESEKEKNKKVRQTLSFIQKPLRLRRNKPQKFIYPVYFLVRRMILALTFVYLQNTTSP